MPSSRSISSTSWAPCRLVHMMVIASGRGRGDLAQQRRSVSGLDLAEREVHRQVEMALGDALDADAARSWRRCAAARRRRTATPGPACARPGAASSSLSASTEVVAGMPVASVMRAHSARSALEAEPARRGAAPADHVDPRVGQQPRRVEDLALVELVQRRVAHRDLGHREAREVRRHARHGATMALVSGSRAVLEDGVSTPMQFARCMAGSLRRAAQTGSFLL